jgi:YbbR domain-containing protein
MHVPGFITRNFRLKLGCTVLAVIFWAGVVYAGNPPETRTVTVSVPQGRSAIPAKFTLVQPVQQLAVRVGGNRSSLDAFNASSLVVNVAWQSVKAAGVQQVPIAITNNDPNVDLIDPPTSISADLDTLTSAMTTVNIDVTNPPPQGYTIASESATPASVVLVGPQHELTGAQARVTVDLQNQKTNLVVQQALVLVYDSHGVQLNDVGVNPSTVNVAITVKENLTTRASAVVPRTTGNPAPGHYLAGLSASPASVVLSGSQDLLNALDSISTSTISLNGLTGSVTLTVSLTPPAGVTASPSTVTVTILINTLPTPSPAPTPSPTAPSPT